jgi:hypothetical protein
LIDIKLILTDISVGGGGGGKVVYKQRRKNRIKEKIAQEM